MRSFLLFTLSCGLFCLVSCGGGKETSGQIPLMSPDPAAAALQKAAETAEKEKAAQAAMAAPITPGEFSLTITPDDNAKSAFAIPVHILSLRKEEVAQYKALGADGYWKSPSGSAAERIFGSSGSKGTVTLGVPSRAGADTILIIAKLPPTAGGGDARMMEVPLVRQAGTDPLRPTTPAISVRLSRIGLLPN